jgi:chain length determinant protein tyrosine kinase EpsG
MNAPENVVMLEAAGRVVAPRRDRAIGSILVEEGKLDASGVERIIELQRDKGLKFGEAAMRLGLITERDLNYAVAKQYDLPRLLADNGGATSELVVAHAPFHPRAEEIRSLRTQLLIRWSNTGMDRGVLAVVSPGSGEGRSYVAANLAVAFAQLGERTLLIDADLRRPRQHRIFEVSDRIGLSTMLSGRAGAEAAVPVSEFGRLALLPAGPLPPNPQELLSRLTLASFLKEARAEFDVILVDTPPAKFYADAQIVGFRARSVMVVARKDHTRVADTNSVIQEMGNSGTRVIGTVFNAY